mgnify:CR=1 FL=1
MEKEKVLPYLQNLCARREYCRADIRKKALAAFEGDAAEAEKAVASLVSDRFIDDSRYAAAFAREKSSLTGWGEAKIRYALMMKGVSKEDIAAGLEEIDANAASSRLEKVVATKFKSLQGDPYIKFKLIKFALSRGYGYDEVSAVVGKVLSSDENI